jgi:ABC-2 type transport system permease protein
MKSILIALQVEILKIRKSKVFWLMLVFFAFVPCMIGLLMFVQKYPEISGKLGLIGTKASILRFGEANWTNFFNLLYESNAAIGFIGYGFVTTWVFGREYADHTMKNMLALPIPRVSIVISKFIAVFIWCAILSSEFYITGVIIGKAIQLSGLSRELIHVSVNKYSVASLLTFLLCTVVAFFAGYGRGYLLPLGFIILTLIIANFTGLVGIGPYFPWAIPGIYSTSGVAEGMQLQMVSYLILVITSIAGFIGTLTWWLYADQK